MGREILHCDANCFYASVEMQRDPDLRGRPVAVCGDQEARHGIVLTASYPAKKRGVKTGQAIWQAKQACPDLVVFRRSYNWDKPLRGVGVRGSELVDTTGGVQLSFYADAVRREKWERIDDAMDRLRARYGYLSIQRAIARTDPLLGTVDPSLHTIHPVGYFAG